MMIPRLLLFPFRAMFAALFLLAPHSRAEEESKIFDGSSRVILYQTSSHAGQKQLQELLRMVPGGESFEVLKMPYSWKKTPEKIREYPIIISRLAGGFNRDFRVAKMRKPISPEQQTAGLKLLSEIIEAKLERDQPQVLIGISGHYFQLGGEKQGEALLSTAAIFTAYQQQNKNPKVTVIDTLALTHAHYPLGVRSDQMHASPIANYIEGLEIVKALCARDGIEMPPKLASHVESLIKKAADSRDAFRVLAPMPEDPKTAHAIGDSINIEWEVDDPEVTGIYVMLHRLGYNDYYLSDRIDVRSKKTGSLTWTVQEPLPVLGNRMSRITQLSPDTAKTDYFARKIPGGQKLFCIRIVSADDPSTFTFGKSFTIPFPKKKP